MSQSDPTEVALASDDAPKSRARTAALAVAVLAVLGGAVFAGLSLADDGNSPEDPVRAMFEAVERGDVLGVLEQLEPGERDALRDPMIDLVEELNRIDVLEGADLGDIEGIEVSIEELELASERVADDVANVSITGGRSQYRFDAGELPLGSFVRDLFGEGLDEARSSGEEELEPDEDDIVTTVRRDGRWYVSIGYSTAEAARRSAGVAFDEMGEGITAEGADSPEAAVRELVDAVGDVDVRRMLALLPPGEFGAVHDYAGLFLEEAEANAADSRRGFELDVSTLELESDRSGRRATVFVKDAEFGARIGEGRMSYADGCLTLRVPGAPVEEVCEGDDPAEVLGGRVFGQGMFPEGMFAEIEPPELSFEGKEARFGIATVEVDGAWYVSPTRTVLDNLVETLRLFERSDLVEIRRFVEDMIGAFQDAMTGNLQRLGPAPQGEWMPYDEECIAEAESQAAFEDCFPRPSAAQPAD